MTEANITTQNRDTSHIPTREEFHRHYGGKIYQSDFGMDCKRNSNANGSVIASRIESDYRHFAKLRKDGKFHYGWK